MLQPAPFNAATLSAQKQQQTCRQKIWELVARKPQAQSGPACVPCGVLALVSVIAQILRHNIDRLLHRDVSRYARCPVDTSASVIAAT